MQARAASQARAREVLRGARARQLFQWPTRRAPHDVDPATATNRYVEREARQAVAGCASRQRKLKGTAAGKAVWDRPREPARSQAAAERRGLSVPQGGNRADLIRAALRSNGSFQIADPVTAGETARSTSGLVERYGASE